MANVLGKFNITTSAGSGVSDSSVALIGALSTATASATSDLLGPALDLKAPQNNPLFTGTVGVAGSVNVSGSVSATGGFQGVTANMVTATDPRTNTTSNVQWDGGQVVKTVSP